MKSTSISLFTLGLVLTFVPSASKAQPNPNPPGQISYQGFLTDANGLPLATNNPVNYNIQFRIWNDPSSGSNLWGELQVVTVDRGYFTVLLGNGSTLSGNVPFTNNLAGIFSGSDASDRYLEMTVIGLAPGDPPIQPRLRLLASPFSYLASRSLVAVSALSVDASAAIPDANLSSNVALLNASQAFTGTNKFSNAVTFNNAVGISAANTLEFGAGVAGKEINAGKIGYQTFTPGMLDIVGAGTNGADRKIHLWAEGGATFSGKAFFGGANFSSDATFAGNVGIGRIPVVPLDVSASTAQGFGPYGYLNSSTPTGTGGVAVAGFSIRASARIWATEFDAVSDRRIKDIIGQSDRQADLEVIQKLRVTDFRMKDRVANGDTPRKGFIAQEVETVIPEAVTQSRQFVPDIYAAASGAKFDPAAKTVVVKMAKAHGLKAGDSVRLMTEAGQMDLTVSAVPSEQEFVAANCEKDPKQVFVFGKEVNDFRTLNYDHIFTTGISALQELARRVSTLEAHEAEHVALEKRAARVDELEHEVADLKAAVARLANSEAHQASARGVSRQPATSEQSGVLVAADNAGGSTQQPSTAQPGKL